MKQSAKRYHEAKDRPKSSSLEPWRVWEAVKAMKRTTPRKPRSSLKDDRRSKPFIRAVPNPIPMTTGTGSTTISWSTGDGSRGAVYLLARDKEELPFGAGATGSQSISWIASGYIYQFRLYRGEDRTKPIAVTNVTMGRPLRETVLDYALLTSVLLMPLTMLLALVRFGSWLLRPRGKTPDREGTRVTGAIRRRTWLRSIRTKR
jgi:hypothetical protein